MTRPTPLALAMSALFCALPLAGAHASGFALIEQNASGLGNAYAGQAASAQDASTTFFNPAGLTKIQGRQAVVVGNVIVPSAKFSNDGSFNAMLQSSLGSNGGDAGGAALVPNFYYAMDVRPDIKFGLYVGAPFGLKTEYDDDWVGRFQAVTSDLKTLNINPSLAFKVSDSFSWGVGADLMQVKAELTSMTNYSAALFLASGNTVSVPNLSGLGTVKGDDWGIGVNFGMLFEPQADTRIGISYRSDVTFSLEGDATFANRVGPTPQATALLGMAVPDGAVTADVSLPASASLSLFRKVSPQWELLADMSWTGWGTFEDLTVKRTNGTTLNKTVENWHDTMRYSLGVNYRQDDKMIWRAGLAYDQSPVPNAYRTPRIPDQDRTWLAVGLQYKLTSGGKIDAGYAHIFVKDPSINAGSAVAPGTYPYGQINGEYANKVDIVSVQYTHSF